MEHTRIDPDTAHRTIEDFDAYQVQAQNAIVEMGNLRTLLAAQLGAGSPAYNDFFHDAANTLNALSQRKWPTDNTMEQLLSAYRPRLENTWQSLNGQLGDTASPELTQSLQRVKGSIDGLFDWLEQTHNGSKTMRSWAQKLGLPAGERPVSMVDILGTRGPNDQKGIWV